MFHVERARMLPPAYVDAALRCSSDRLGDAARSVVGIEGCGATRKHGLSSLIRARRAAGDVEGRRMLHVEQAYRARAA